MARHPLGPLQNSRFAPASRCSAALHFSTAHRSRWLRLGSAACSSLEHHASDAKASFVEVPIRNAMSIASRFFCTRFMHVQASVRPRCKSCRVVRRRGRLFVICITKKHKQRQG